MLEMLKALPDSPILSLIEAYAQDTNPNKIDLGVGVYKDASGLTPVMGSVKLAEEFLFRTEKSKTYVNIVGNSQFNQGASHLVLGNNHPVMDENRLINVQVPGGCGALRLGGEVIRRAKPGATIWISDPTWENHINLFESAGLKIAKYPYYDYENHTVRFNEILSVLESDAHLGDVVLLHACCHNPSGADITTTQWQRLTELFLDKGLIPFVDLAYQGFGKGLEQDVQGLRHMAVKVPEMLIANSYSKNFGLYRERVGSLFIIARETKMRQQVYSQLVTLMRGMYSMASSHGASIVGTILASEELTTQWRNELASMRIRINNLRTLADEKLGTACTQGFGFIQKQRGMFSFLGLSEDSVSKLVRDYSIYMVSNGRINIAGLNDANIDYFANSIARVVNGEA